VRSGYVAAKPAATGPPSPIPRITAWLDPTASITARTSSIRSASVGTTSAGSLSESPTPRLSKRSTRLKRASPSTNRISPGSSAVVSRWFRKPDTSTRSSGALPTTRYATLHSPLFA